MDALHAAVDICVYNLSLTKHQMPRSIAHKAKFVAPKAKYKSFHGFQLVISQQEQN
jgi:hypothetical protein